VVVVSLLRPLAIDGRFPLDLDRGIQLVFLALAAAGAVVHRPRYHEAITAASAVLLLAYVALLFARLR
jgi:hypothetical protein